MNGYRKITKQMRKVVIIFPYKGRNIKLRMEEEKSTKPTDNQIGADRQMHIGRGKMGGETPRGDEKAYFSCTFKLTKLLTHSKMFIQGWYPPKTFCYKSFIHSFAVFRTLTSTYCMTFTQYFIQTLRESDLFIKCTKNLNIFGNTC